MQETVTRRIFFYRTTVVCGPDEEPEPFDPMAVCEEISNLSFEDGERYLDDRDGGDISVWPQPLGGVARMMIGSVRRSGLPQVEDVGQIDPLDLAETKGLVEFTHVVFFPKGIVGAEFNFYGPRINRLRDYIKAKCSYPHKLSFDMLLQDDPNVLLDDMADVRLLKLKIRRDYLDLLKDAEEGLPQALLATSEHLNSPVLELGFLQEPYSQQTMNRASVLGFLRALAGDTRTRDGIHSLKGKALSKRTGRVESFDLLKDYLISEKDVVKQDPRFRHINSESMFSAIRTAYEELKDQLEAAAGVSEAE